MIDSDVELALLDEMDRLGLTQEQRDSLWRWALKVRLSGLAMDGLIDGSMQIAGLNADGEPLWEKA